MKDYCLAALKVKIDFFGNWNWCAKMLPDSETFLRTVFDFRRSLMVFLALIFAGCTTESEAAGVIGEVPELIRPATATIDTAFVERGRVANFSRRTGVTRHLSQPVYFDNPVANFGEFFVSPGDFVTEGQLLAILDTENLDERIEEQEENLANLRRNHAVAYEIRQIDIDIMVLEHTRSMTRAAEAFDANALEAAVVQELNIERARMELRQQQDRQTMQLRQSEERLSNLRERRAQAELFAPMDGQITYMADISEGQSLNVAQPLIFITDGNEIVIEAVNLISSDWPPPPAVDGPRPPQPWIPAPVRNAVYITGRIGSQVIDLEYIDLPFYERNPSGIPSPVRFTPSGDIQLEGGQYVDIFFYTHRFEDVLRIPANSLFFDAGRAYVNRVVGGELVATTVQLYTNTPIFAAVREGLEVGDEIFVRP